MKLDLIQRLEGFFRRDQYFQAALESPAFFRIASKAKSSQLSEARAQVLRADTLISTLDILAKRFNGLSGMLGSLEEVVLEKARLGEILRARGRLTS